MAETPTTILVDCIHCDLEVEYDPEHGDAARYGNPDCWSAPRRPCQGCKSNGESDPGCHDCADTGSSWMGLHDVHPRWKLDEDARAVIAGVFADPAEVNRNGITASDRIWEMIRAAFPLELFQAWAEKHPGPDDEGNGYNPDAE